MILVLVSMLTFERSCQNSCMSSHGQRVFSPWLVPTSNLTFAKFLSVTLEDVHLLFTSLKWTESTSVARVVHVMQKRHMSSRIQSFTINLRSRWISRLKIYKDYTRFMTCCGPLGYTSALIRARVMQTSSRFSKTLVVDEEFVTNAQPDTV